MLAVPLKARGHVIGAVIIVYAVGRVLREDEIRLAEAFADQVALALENTRLLAETRGRLADSETLLAVAGVLSQPVPGTETMRRVAREAARAFGADMAGIYALDATRQAFRAIAGYHVPRISGPHSRRPRFPWSCSMRPSASAGRSGRRTIWPTGATTSRS